MIFTSYTFAVFFCIFFLIYWLFFKRNLRLQNLLILSGSYTFYLFWDWRFLILLIGITTVTFFIGKKINNSQTEKHNSLLFYLGLFIVLGNLLIFKYFNFFISSFKDVFTLLGIDLKVDSLKIILPLGISFYTFRLISYLLDIRNKKVKPVDSWIVFYTYVSYFPSLVSGPIDRTKTLVPQLEQVRVFDYENISGGLRQILWGMFKKIVISNNCLILTNQIFDNYNNFPASSLIIGAFFYTIQIYADFSGYSDMAIGISRLLGIRITKNFNYPFFSQNIIEFWQKWHISLTTWVTDYVFTPLTISLRDYGKAGLIIAIFVNFIVIGIWHGASWTYIMFGIIQASLFVPLILNGAIFKKKKKLKNKYIPTFSELRNIILTFLFIMLSIVFFRLNSMEDVFNYFRLLFSYSLFDAPILDKVYLKTSVFICILLLVEWVQKNRDFGLDLSGYKLNILIRWTIYYLIIFFIIGYGGNQKEFIYFQF